MQHGGRIVSPVLTRIIPSRLANPPRLDGDPLSLPALVTPYVSILSPLCLQDLVKDGWG